MTWVAAAMIGGGAALGAGGSIAGSLIQSNAAKEAAGLQESAGINALNNTNSLARSAVNYLSPYASAGIGAGNTLSSLFVDPTTKYTQLNAQRAQLQSAVDQYSKGIMWDTFPIMTGDRASERRAQAYQQAEYERNQNLQQAQNALKSFDSQYSPDYLNQLKSGTDPFAPKLQTNPFLQQVTDLTTRDVNRALAARGGYDSGSSSEAIANALAPINYNAVQFATQGLQGLYQTGAQAADRQASVTANVIPTEASIYGGIGAAQAGGVMGSANAITGGINGVANSISSGVGTGLNYSLNSSLYNGLVNKLNAQNSAGNVAANNNGFNVVGGNTSGGYVNAPAGY